MTTVRPPRAPWTAISSTTGAGGYLSFYYSDDLSALPVRWVTKPMDNKSDPNLETGTYGVFSTCSPGMRSGVVRRQIPIIFFCTRRNDRRELTGFYDIGWFAKGPLGSKDYCLAARLSHFVRTPVPLCEVDRLLGTTLSRPFRGVRLLTNTVCDQLHSLITQQPDATPEYLAEIDRLERFNLKHGGYRYVSWRQSQQFTWEYANQYLITQPNAPTLSNASDSGKWCCNSCGEDVTNKALLKRCPSCGKLGSLRSAP